MAVTFEAPGPGRWELDRSHFPGGTTPIAQWLMCESMGPGIARVMEEQGVPAKTIASRFVNGYHYTRLVPLIGGDKPPKRLPPKFVLRLAARAHPAFRARTRTARKTFEDRPWNDVAADWHRDMQPRLAARNAALQSHQPAVLDDAALATLVGELLDHLRETTELHFWLHGHDLGPIARYLHACTQWGLEPTEALDALVGASPSTSRPLEQLAALRAEIESRDIDVTSLTSFDDVRAVSPAAAAMLDEYLAERGNMLVTGYDITSLTLYEVPGVVLAALRSAVKPVATDYATLAEGLRSRVPVAEQGRFDMLLSDARGVMDMRDDNGPLTYELPAGLLRRALLEVGRRLAASGRLEDPEHALDLHQDEARDPFGPGLPSPAEMARRAEQRQALEQLTPPQALGPVEPAPPIDVLPDVLAEMVSSIETALTHLAMTEGGGAGPHADPLTGVGIGAAPHTGTARTAASADEAIDKLEPGDVLVVRATSPAFNAVLAVAGAVVTTHGGALSHAAVLARELGIPAVVGAAGALRIPDGSTVTVDPVLGKVTVIETQRSAAADV
jgi:phosphohistidine swiveling domain-containing protein